jgi:peptide/nickel transport system substrate-binding protein
VSRDEIVVATEKPPITLDPRFDIDTASENAVELLFNGLLRVNERLEVVPDLAASFEAVDAKTYRFRVKPGVRFHDGTPLRAEDVKETFEYLADPANGSPFRTVFRLLRSAAVTAPDTVEVRLTEPYAFFPDAARRPVVSRALMEKLGRESSRRAVGTGPFRLVSFDERTGLVLERFDGYFGGAPSVRRVRLKPVLDVNSRILELLKGSADVVQNTSDGFPPGTLQRLGRDPRIRITSRPGTNVQYLNFNLRHPVLGNAGVRRAIAHAIDREAIVKAKLSGYGRVAPTFLPPSHWAFEPDVPLYPYDPARANRLLDEAGYPDPDGPGPKKRFSILYRTSTNPQSIEIAEVIRGHLEAAGIGVELRSVAFGVLFEDIKKGNFDVYTLQWTSVLTPDHYYEVFHSRSVPPDGYNRNFYANPKVDRLLEEGRRTVDRAAQKRIYSEAQRLVAADLPALPLWYPEQISAVGARVDGWETNPRGTYDALARVTLGPP